MAIKVASKIGVFLHHFFFAVALAAAGAIWSE
jgi:hypothetical protein